MGQKRVIWLLVAFGALFFSFQNCSPVSYQDQTPQLKLGNNSDSGQHYDGKIYVHMGALCSDLSEVRSKIVLKSSSSAELVRQDCRDLNPSVTLNSNDFRLESATPNQLTFQNQVFNLAAPDAQGITNFLASSDGTNLSFSYTYSGSPSWKQVFLDVDGDSTTGFSRGGLGADYMIENDNLWRYSAAAGSPSDTWSWTVVVTANKVDITPNISWRIPIRSLGSPTVLKAMAQTSAGYRAPVQIISP